MNKRVSIFENTGDEDTPDFDVAGFAPKTPQANTEPATTVEEFRAVAEKSSFRSREPGVPPQDLSPPTKRHPRRHRTGRNAQFNVKLRADSVQSFYDIANRKAWTMGETVERALAALQRELGS